MLGGNTYGTPVAIVASDTQLIAPVLNALYVGGAGNVTVGFLGSAAPVLLVVIAGALLPFQINKVYATGTTATGLVGFIG